MIQRIRKMLNQANNLLTFSIQYLHTCKSINLFTYDLLLTLQISDT